MIDALSDGPLDFTGYRHVAAYVLALVLLHRARRPSLTLKLGSRRDADWLAARLHHRGYVAEVEAPGGQAVVTVRNTP